jgi:hypothetical protein
MPLVLYHKTSGIPVKIGDHVTSFRGEEATVLDIVPPRHEGSTGRVYTELGAHYPSVYDLHWIEE